MPNYTAALKNSVPTRYTEVHLNQNGPGDARPTGIQIVQDSGLVDALKDKVYSAHSFFVLS